MIRAALSARVAGPRGWAVFAAHPFAARELSGPASHSVEISRGPSPAAAPNLAKEGSRCVNRCEPLAVWLDKIRCRGAETRIREMGFDSVESLLAKSGWLDNASHCPLCSVSTRPHPLESVP